MGQQPAVKSGIRPETGYKETINLHPLPIPMSTCDKSGVGVANPFQPLQVVGRENVYNTLQLENICKLLWANVKHWF